MVFIKLSWIFWALKDCSPYKSVRFWHASTPLTREGCEWEEGGSDCELKWAHLLTTWISSRLRRRCYTNYVNDTTSQSLLAELGSLRSFSFWSQYYYDLKGIFSELQNKIAYEGSISKYSPIVFKLYTTSGKFAKYLTSIV